MQVDLSQNYCFSFLTTLIIFSLAHPELNDY